MAEDEAYKLFANILADIDRITDDIKKSDIRIGCLEAKISELKDEITMLRAEAREYRVGPPGPQRRMGLPGCS